MKNNQHKLIGQVTCFVFGCIGSYGLVVAETVWSGAISGTIVLACILGAVNGRVPDKLGGVIVGLMKAIRGM